MVLGLGSTGAQQRTSLPAPSLSPSGPPPLLPAASPDILLVLWDDVGAVDVEQLSALVPSHMPALDALAAQGARLRRMHGQPQCAFSRVSLILSTWRGTDPQGRWGGFACEDPDLGGALDTGPDEQTIPCGISSLPKALEGAGYTTGYFGRLGLGTHAFADPGEAEYVWTPHLWGFETWRAGSPDGIASCVPAPGVAGYSNWLRVDDGDAALSSEYNTSAIVEEFTAWWLSTPSPKFAMVATNAAHKGGPFDEWHVPPASALRPGTVLSPSPNARTRYLLMIESLDYALERMLAVVSLPDTLVVVTADNGTPREVKPPGYTVNQVKFSVFEGGTRVPGVVAGLRFPSGIVSDQPASVVDLAPTFCDLAGVPWPPEFQGQSLVPALWREPLQRDWTYTQRGAAGDRAATARRVWGGALGAGLRTWKLLEQVGSPPVLFDLDSDPKEDFPIDPATPGLEEVASALREIFGKAVP